MRSEDGQEGKGRGGSEEEVKKNGKRECEVSEKQRKEVR
jgi:hypothetical protein